MDNLTTLVETMNALRKEGYTEDFNLKSHCIVCGGSEIDLHPEDFSIDQVFRFYGDSDPDDESVLYAISSKIHGIKGVLVNSFGIYADSMSTELAAKLQYH
jgi:rRNA maturation protein Nop10